MNINVSKSSQAYEIIEEMITFQELVPGNMYSESKLITMTDLGRSPIREALQKLAVDKLVEIFPSKGILVTPISIETQTKLLEVRRNVGEFAMQLAAKRASLDDKKAMKILIGELYSIQNFTQIRLLVRLLKQAHCLTIQATKNEFIDSILSPLQSSSRRFWVAHLQERDDELKTVATIYANKLLAICDNDESATVQASLKINDYFTQYTYQVLTGLSKTL